jgi:hypothetical protein
MVDKIEDKDKNQIEDKNEVIVDYDKNDVNILNLNE